MIKRKRGICAALTLAAVKNADRRIVPLSDQPDLRLRHEHAVSIVEHRVNGMRRAMVAARFLSQSRPGFVGLLLVRDRTPLEGLPFQLNT